MITVDLIQGTPEWHAHRAQHDNASDAPAMMGESPYETRTELLHRLATGITPDVDAATQARFDDGHRAEALARPLAEEIIGESLYPVTGTKGRRSASFDGLTLSERKAFEHKSLNKVLRAVMVPGCTGADLPLLYRIQMEQQCEISECEEVLFMASKWEGETLIEERHCWYKPDLALRAQINAGWDQLNAERATYVAVEVLDKPVARVATSLPSVSVQVSGALVVRDNFGKYEAALRHFIDKDLIVKPETDQDFADMAAQIKALKGAEEALDAAEAQMLSQVESVDTIRRTKEMLHKLARDHRLAAEKRLDARKLAIKGEIVAEGVTAFREHIEALNTRLGKPYMPAIAADFGGVIKNLRTVESLRNAVNTELARVKILANETADRIDANLKHLRETASKHIFLFSDTSTIVLKAPDDLQALVTNRINAHEQAEQKRLDEQREQIRKEEAARLEREAREAQAQKNAMAMQEIQGIQQQVAIAISGRLGVRKGGTIECIRDTLAETENWPITEANFGALTGAAQAAKDKAVTEIRATLAAAEIKHTAAEVQCGIDAARKEEALPTILLDELTKTVSAISSDSAASLAISTAKASASEKPTLKLGDINARLEVVSVSAEQLAKLGFTATVDKGARLYKPSDYPRICEALIQHLTTVADEVTA